MDTLHAMFTCKCQISGKSQLTLHTANCCFFINQLYYMKHCVSQGVQTCQHCKYVQENIQYNVRIIIAVYVNYNVHEYFLTKHRDDIYGDTFFGDVSCPVDAKHIYNDCTYSDGCNYYPSYHVAISCRGMYIYIYNECHVFLLFLYYILSSLLPSLLPTIPFTLPHSLSHSYHALFPPFSCV